MDIKSNIINKKLLDEFSGKLLGGKIQIASNRGYPSNKEKKQQDAVGSIVRNKHCFLNVVADGIGGSSQGEIASRTLVEEIMIWFAGLTEEEINNYDLICKLLQNKIDEITLKLDKKYEGKSQTTFVLAITNKEITIIGSIGDSTAYEYNEEEKYVEKLNELDSWAEDCSSWYEDLRYSQYRDIVNAAVGDFYKDKVHISVVDNAGQRIILSTDGVTDLVNEETFTSYFTENIDVNKIIDDAINHPDVEYLDKKEDNVSAIVIDLPCTVKERKHKIKKKEIRDEWIF